MEELKIRTRLNSTVQQLRDYVPIIAPYFDMDLPLREYSTQLQQHTITSIHEARLELIASSARNITKKVFGNANSEIPITINDVRAVNIVDHHQLLNHPLLLGTNIIPNASRLISSSIQKPIVTISCSNVSPSNYYLRNGFQFRGHSVSYFSQKEYQDVIYYADERVFDFVERLKATKRFKNFSNDDQNFLVEYQEILNGLVYSKTGRHKDQIVAALVKTWPMLFHSSIRSNIPKLVYINGEELTKECLIKLLSEDSFLIEALINQEFLTDIIKEFRGIVIAWDEAAGKGTHFFWRKHPPQPRLLRMYARNGYLVPADPRYEFLKVPLERSAILDHLKRDEIVPAVSLIISLLLYTGMRPLVGPGSLVYTTQLKNGWVSLLNKYGYTIEAELMKNVDTGGLIAGTPLFFKREESGLKTLYATDIIANGGIDAEYLNTVLNVPLKDILSVGSGGVYDLFANSYIPKDKQLDSRVSFDEAAALVHHWI